MREARSIEENVPRPRVRALTHQLGNILLKLAIVARVHGGKRLGGDHVRFYAHDIRAWRPPLRRRLIGAPPGLTMARFTAEISPPRGTCGRRHSLRQPLLIAAAERLAEPPRIVRPISWG